jgi:hypothetical protein
MSKLYGAIVAVIVWYVDLQLPVQSVPITTKVVSSNPIHGENQTTKFWHLSQLGTSLTRLHLMLQTGHWESY